MTEPQTELTARQTVMLREAGISVEEWKKATVSVEEFCRLLGIKHPLTNFMGEPQLSAEFREWLANWDYAHLTRKVPVEESRRMADGFAHTIATALEEERAKVLSEVEKMKKTDKFPQSLTTYDGKTKYFNRLNDGDLHYNQAIQDVLAKLNQLKGNHD